MSFSKIVFIVNPHAGNGSAGADWPVIETLAKDRLGVFETCLTGGPGDAAVFAKDAVEKGADLLVCVGGDGTLNEVLNGVMRHGETRRSDLVLGFVPDGTGCDFVKTVSIPRNLEQSIDLIAARKVRSIDVGKITFRGHTGSDAVRFFLNIASFGLGGEVVEKVNRTTKAFGPFISFLWATLISIFQYGKKRIHLTVDDNFENELAIWHVAVANGQFQGGGMWVAPDAAVDDGLFHVTVVGDLSLAEVFLNLPKLYNGKIKDIDKVITMVGKKIEATSDMRVLLDVDGEQPGNLPVGMAIMPGAINIITE
ncbi:MAG: diacylglycerol kinase family protein [Pseudomonadota bacterium]